ncbi:adenylate/guanylate cyclase domain-containing protein [Xanthomonas sp. 10-10]|uniref:Adenylate/guanylate cyclase domain-containing protein n=1 Tax=Xanthomonas sp. 10-10 TaxID=3115848 RepID=A0AAU7P3L6_9XANT
MEVTINSLIENTVANYLASTVGYENFRPLRAGADFEVRKGGQRYILEIKARKPGEAQLVSLLKNLSRLDLKGAKIALITTNKSEVNDKDRERFSLKASAMGYDATWIDLSELADFLGTEPMGDLSSPETMSRVQTRSLIKSVERYSGSPIGVLPFDTKADQQLSSLARQFNHHSVADLYQEPSLLEEKLRLGKRVEQVTVVLTDIVNFSSLVTASRPEDLRSAMEKYYRLAREAVFSHGGMLDKFIGDAVLAVFGYPQAGGSASTNAIKFGNELISIGQEVLSTWQDDLNANIPTGTRVGIATGDIWPINIGADQLEITLLGDTINLAARLEKNCSHNGVLIDNRTKTKAEREGQDILAKFAMAERLLNASEAKGQVFDVRCWQLSEGGGAG